MTMMAKPGEASKELFRALLPADPRVSTRPMFGNLAGFVNGTMFAGLFGDALFMRLAEAERETLLREDGAKPFEPMAGRPMREYVVVPEAWHVQPERIRPWIERSLAWTATLPAKAPKEGKAGKKA